MYVCILISGVVGGARGAHKVIRGDTRLILNHGLSIVETAPKKCEE